MDFSDLFSNGKSDGPGPRRVDRVARLGSTVDRGGADKRARLRLGVARALWLISAHRRSGEGRARQGGAGGVLTRARVVVKRRRDRDEERQRLVLGVRAKEGVRELGGEGEKGR
jgi:hypothetical protein